MPSSINRRLLQFCRKKIPPQTSSSQSWDHSDEIEDILNRGANPNFVYKGTTPLCEASRLGNDIAVELLIERGTNVNLCDKNKCTPLYLAASHGKYEIVRRLVDNGADVNAENLMGYLPLLSAVENSHMNVAKLLVECGAKVNIRRPNTFGIEMSLMTFVLFAKSDIPFAESLLMAGVSPHPFEKPLNFILLEYGDDCRKLIEKMVYAGFDFYCDGWIKLVKNKINLNVSKVSDSERDMVQFLEQEHWNTPSLQRICRTVIRSELSTSRTTLHLCKKIKRLPVPFLLQQFLSLENLA